MTRKQATPNLNAPIPCTMIIRGVMMNRVMLCADLATAKVQAIEFIKAKGNGNMPTDFDVYNNGLMYEFTIGDQKGRADFSRTYTITLTKTPWGAMKEF
jgi:hypothetical protein